MQVVLYDVSKNIIKHLIVYCIKKAPLNNGAFLILLRDNYLVGAGAGISVPSIAGASICGA